MNTAVKAESAQDIVQRMERQRAQLHQQFVRKPEPVASTAVVSVADSPVQPHEYKSLLMRLLVANPQLIRRVLVLAATTALGARYSSWTMQLVGMFLASRRRAATRS